MRFIIGIMSFIALTTACNDIKTHDNHPSQIFEFTDSLDFELQELAQATRIPGFAVSIVDANGTLFQKTYGLADKEEVRPYTEQTIQLIASVSKTFIGVALMQLVEKGKVNLDDPINQYLPFKIRNPHHPEVDITFRMLVTHTSSIDDYDDGDGSTYWLIDPIPEPRSEIPKKVLSRLEYFELGSPFTLAQCIEYALSEKGKWYSKDNYLKAKPGTLNVYSNIGASLTAYLVEIISSQSFESYTQENIFAPLGMSNTAWHYEDLTTNDLATIYTTYDSMGTTQTFPLPKYAWGDFPDGGMMTNIVDLSYYVNEMIRGLEGQGKLLSSEGYQTLFRPQLNDSHYPDGRSEYIFNDGYDSGVFWGRNHDGYILHNGGDDGVTSNVMINPKTGVGMIAFSNIGDNVFVEILNIVSKWEQKIE